MKLPIATAGNDSGEAKLAWASVRECTLEAVEAKQSSEKHRMRSYRGVARGGDGKYRDLEMTKRGLGHSEGSDVRSRRWAALMLVAVGVGAAAVGQAVLPQILVWLLAAMLVWAGVTVWVSGGASSRKGIRRQPWSDSWRRPRDLKPGERYDTAVRLTEVANVPLAEMICSRLKANGIEAFYKGVSPYGGPALGQAATNPAFPAEIWVGAGQVDQARQLLD